MLGEYAPTICGTQADHCCKLTFFARRARVRSSSRSYSGRIVRPAGILILSLAVAALARPGVPPASETMIDRINERVEEIVRGFHGVVGVAAIDLSAGAPRELVAVHADVRFPTASTIKTAVMVEAYRQAAEGTLAFDASLTLRETDKVGGSGVLRNLHDGLSLTVGDAVELMIALSDNTATNLLIARLGTARVNAQLDAYGLPNTRLFRPTFRDGRPDVLPELEREFGLGMTTPREMARLMARIAEGQAVSATASAGMLATLRRQQDRAMIPRLLPPDDVEVGNKTGTDEEKQAGPGGVKGQVRADAAIVAGPGGLRYVIAIYTRQVEDKRWSIDNDALTTGARISRLVYDEIVAARAR
jgi:beta-lactamase class A